MLASMLFSFILLFIYSFSLLISCIRPAFPVSGQILLLGNMTKVGDGVLVFKELFGAGFLKHKYTEILEKKYCPGCIKACIDLSKGII